MSGSQAGSQAQLRVILNADFRRAIAAEVAALCEGHAPTRRRSTRGEPLPQFGLYSGGSSVWPHLAELISNELQDADSSRWLDTEEVQKIIYKGDRALPPERNDRQVFLQVVQRVMNACFDSEQATRAIAESVSGMLTVFSAHLYCRQAIGRSVLTRLRWASSGLLTGMLIVDSTVFTISARFEGSISVKNSDCISRRRIGWTWPASVLTSTRRWSRREARAQRWLVTTRTRERRATTRCGSGSHKAGTSSTWLLAAI